MTESLCMSDGPRGLDQAALDRIARLSAREARWLAATLLEQTRTLTAELVRMRGAVPVGSPALVPRQRTAPSVARCSD